MPTLVAEASSSERKKRTRPVSACENCRSKKVKCHLLPDRPVCKGCAQSGKECLFRIDDLSPALRRERFAEYGVPEEDHDSTQQPPRRRRKRSSVGQAGGGGGGNAHLDGNDDELGAESGSKSKPVFRSFANPTKLAAPSASTSTFRSESDSTERSNGSEHRRFDSQSDDRPVSQGQQALHHYNGAHPSSSAADGRQTYANGHGYNASNINGHGMSSYEMRQHQDVYHSAVPPYPNAQPIWPNGVHHEGQLHGHYDNSRTNTSLSPTRQYYDREAGVNHHPFQASLPPPPPPGLSRQPSFPHLPASDHYPTSQPPVQSRDFAARPPLPAWGGSGVASSPRSVQALANSNAQQYVGNQQDDGVNNDPSRHLAQPHSSTFGLAKRHPSFGSSRGSARPTELSTHGSDGIAINTVRSNPSVEDDQSLSHGIERNDLAAASKLEEEQETAEAKNQKNVSFGRRYSSKTSQNGLSGTLTSLSDHTTSPRSTSTSSKPPATFKKIALPFFRWFGATANTPGIRRIKVGVYHDQDMDVVASEAGTPAITTSALPMGNEHETPDATSVTGSAAAAAVSPLEERRNLALSRGSPLKASLSPQAFTSPAFQGPPTGPSMAAIGAESVLSTSARELFESSRPRYPRKDLLLHLCDLFIKYFKASCFPWIDDAELMASAESGELPAISANAICAVAARFSGHADISRAKNPSESFADMAKVLIVPMLSWPSIEVIEALIILSYAEFGAGADAGLWMYIGMALRMATDLGLQHELTIQSMATKKQQERARFMFWAIVCLDRITCFGTGRPLTIRDDTYDCQLPPLEQDAAADGFVFGYIVRTLLKRGRIGELLNRREDDMAFEQRGAQLRALWLDLANYYETLPTDLHFSVNTFRKLAAADKGSAFVYLHILMQSTISLLNRPSLLRRFDKDFMVTAPSSLAGIANHASGTIVSILRFAVDAGNHRARTGEEHSEVNPYLDCNPYLDQLILPAGRSFLSERESAKETLRSFGHQGPLSRPVTRDGQDKGAVKPFGVTLTNNDELFKGLNTRRQYAQTNIESCQEVLDRIAKWWNGAQWPARALRQEAQGDTEEDEGPDGPDEEAQPAPIRDVEMVLRWARARRIRARRTTPAESRRHSDASAENKEGGGGGANGQAETPGLGGAGYANGSGAIGANGQSEGGAGPYDLSSLWHDPGGADASPLGLGFSGSLGAASEIDVDALINAWAKELGTVGSTSAIHGDVGTPAAMTLGLRGGGNGPSSSYDHMTPGAAHSRSRPISRPVSRSVNRAKVAPTTPGGMADIFGGPPPHHNLSGSVYDLPGWPGGAGQNGMNIDLSAMQMEEFFFDSDPSTMNGAPTLHHDHHHDNATAADHHATDSTAAAASVSTQPVYDHHANHDRGLSAFATHKEEAYIGQTNSNAVGGPSQAGTIVHQNLDILPAALLNTLNLHPGHTHFYAPQPAPNAGE